MHGVTVCVCSCMCAYRHVVRACWPVSPCWRVPCTPSSASETASCAPRSPCGCSRPRHTTGSPCRATRSACSSPRPRQSRYSSRQAVKHPRPHPKPYPKPNPHPRHGTLHNPNPYPSASPSPSPYPSASPLPISLTLTTGIRLPPSVRALRHPARVSRGRARLCCGRLHDPFRVQVCVCVCVGGG